MKPALTIAVLACVLTLHMAANAAPLARIVLAEKAETRNLQPHLGEIARIECASPSLADSLMRIALPPLDPEHPQAMLTQAAVAGIVAQHRIIGIEVCGAGSTFVAFPGIVFTPAKCAQFIADEMRGRGQDAGLIVFKQLPPLATLEGGAALRLVYPAALGEHLPTALELIAGEKHLQSVSLRNHMKFRVQAMHTATPVSRGTNCAASDFILREAELLPGAALIAAIPDGGMEWKADLPAGIQVLPAYLFAPPLVQRGDEVVLEFAESTVSISARGIALNNGAMGQSVQVRMPTGRVVKAVVTGAGRVRVGEEE
jgi:flagella basal body P-ring formation protein FlgA